MDTVPAVKSMKVTYRKTFHSYGIFNSQKQYYSMVYHTLVLNYILCQRSIIHLKHLASGVATALKVSKIRADPPPPQFWFMISQNTNLKVDLNAYTKVTLTVLIRTKEAI